jgi:hypothetical protein
MMSLAKTLRRADSLLFVFLSSAAPPAWKQIVDSKGVLGPRCIQEGILLSYSLTEDLRVLVFDVRNHSLVHDIDVKPKGIPKNRTEGQ